MPTWSTFFSGLNELTHWGRVTHICVGKLTIIGWDNGLSPGRHQAIFWTNEGILLTHWGRVTHICVDNLTIIGSYNGLSPYRHRAIIWTNIGILFIGPLETNFSEISIEILRFSFMKMHLKMLSVKWHPFCLSLNVLIGPIGTNASVIFIEIQTFSLTKICFKMSSVNAFNFISRLIELMSLTCWDTWYIQSWRWHHSANVMSCFEHQDRPGAGLKKKKKNKSPLPCCIFLSKKCKHAFSINSQHGEDTGWRNSLLTHWPLGDLDKILDKSFFKLILVIDGWGISCEIAVRWMSVDLCDDKSTLVEAIRPLGTKPLTEPMLTQFYAAIWHHQASMS